MTTTPPNLTKLSFDEIKDSLTTYLKNQSIFEGYRFEGSVIQTLIDLLAYNTYYYAFYSNMMSNEMFLDTTTRLDSLVSLVKPLGYTVPGKKSSSTTIKIFVSGGNDSTIPRYTAFPANTADGVYYNFYNVTPISLSAGLADNILVVEASNAVDRRVITSLVDLTKQRYILDDENVDISTIRVEVKHLNGDWEEWTNVNFFPNNEENIYYVDRMGSIFTIEFGKNNHLGKSILPTDSVRISYLVSSGSVANDLNFFSGPDSATTILNVYLPTSNGSDGPDFNAVKFLAPKVFSGQERAVTKQDYLSLLLKNNLISSSNQVSIYGGDEVYPPKYGRVFISFLQYHNLGNEQEILSFLRDKNMLTVLPEYMLPVALQASIIASFGISTTLTEGEKQSLLNNIKNRFNISYSDYINNYTFNLSFVSTNFAADLAEQFPLTSGLQSTTIEKIKYKFTFGDTPVSEISFNYPISISAQDSERYITDPFLYTDNTSFIKIKIPSTGDPTTHIPLEAWKLQANGSYAQDISILPGEINLQNGHIVINKIYATNTLDFMLTSYNKNINPALVSIATKVNLVSV